MHLSIAPGRERKYFNSCILMSSAHVVMLAQLPNKLHFPTTFFGPFFYVVEAGKLLLGIVPGLLNPISLTLSQHLLQPLWHAECHGGTESVGGSRTAKQCLLLCLPSRNLLSGRNNIALNKKLLLFPIKQKLLPINHLIPELCSSILLSLLLTILATPMSFNAVSLQNGFLIK